jgi:hypothetical protein
MGGEETGLASGFRSVESPLAPALRLQANRRASTLDQVPGCITRPDVESLSAPDQAPYRGPRSAVEPNPQSVPTRASSSTL